MSHHSPTGASAFVPDPLASGGGFHSRYDGADCATLSDEPHLLAVNLVRSNGLEALTGHCLKALTGHYVVEMLPQPDLLLAEEHFAALKEDRFSPSVARPTSSPAIFWESPTPH